MADERSNRRYHPRRKIYMSCQVDSGECQTSGKIVEASAGGITILLPQGAESIEDEARIHISPVRQTHDEFSEVITLHARPVHLQKKSRWHRVGFKIEQIESGESEWTRLCRELS